MKTVEELDLVNELVEKITKQAKLLKIFANSEEFNSLEEYIVSGYDDYIAWAVDTNRKIHDKDPGDYAIGNALLIKSTMINKEIANVLLTKSNRITKAVEANLRSQAQKKPEIKFSDKELNNHLL